MLAHEVVREAARTTNDAEGALDSVGDFSYRAPLRFPEGPLPSATGTTQGRVVVGVAQLVEPRIVIPVVVGSSPIVHPISS